MRMRVPAAADGARGLAIGARVHEMINNLQSSKAELSQSMQTKTQTQKHADQFVLVAERLRQLDLAGLARSVHVIENLSKQQATTR